MVRCMNCMAEFDEGQPVCPHCGYARGTKPKEAYHLEPGTVLQGRYIAGRVLGFGGFGVTYIGYDGQLVRKVAIKEFLPSSFATRMPGDTAITVYAGEATEQFGAGLSRFVEEARRLAQFNGIPGIVDIYDSFTSNNTAYIVMEYLQGQDAKEMLAANGPMPYEYARNIILKICDTLQPVHEKGIIHRDISPDNIYLTTSGDVKLLDFGASRYATSINSKSLSVILKSGYAPEEQYRSRGDQGPWSDVYALAATFYKLLTGVTPPDSMERAIKDELKPPSKLGIQLPQSSENAILNAMNIRKPDRTQSVADFKAQLLADGVQRVVPKPVKEDTGRMPGWLKAVLGGGAAAVLLFALLTFTGVINFGQGNLLKGAFGTGVPEGQVNTPGITNIMEEDAKRAAENAGLDYQVIATRYDNSIERGRVLEQTPLPGTLLDEGAVIEVIVSGGGWASAIASGELVRPDLTGMPMWQAANMYRAANPHDKMQIEYAYNDSVPAGEVIGYGDDAMQRIQVSAGRDERTSNEYYGDIRGQQLVQGDNGLPQLVFTYTNSSEDLYENYMIIEFYYSVDGGANWMPVKDPASQEAVNYRCTVLYEENSLEQYYPPVHVVNVGWLISYCYPELAGQEISLRMGRIPMGHNSYDQVVTMWENEDYWPVDQTLTFALDGEVPQVGEGSAHSVNWGEIETLVNDGAITWQDYIARCQDPYNAAEGGYVALQLDDVDATAGERYQIFPFGYWTTWSSTLSVHAAADLTGSGPFTTFEEWNTARCIADGELYWTCRNLPAIFGEYNSANFNIVRLGEKGAVNDSGDISYTISPSGRFTLYNSDIHWDDVGAA